MLFNVHDTWVKVETEITDFANFVGANFAPFVANKRGSFDIEVYVSQKEGERARAEAKNLNRLGNGIRFSEDKIYWENEYGFHILVTNCGSIIRVRAFHDEFLTEQSRTERSQNLQRCMRWTTHFPLFTHLQYRRGWELVHASAVSDGENTMAFCGLNNVGKSTLATYLCREHGYDILTDNFLLVGSHQIYAVPEVIRLNPGSLSRFELESIWDHPVYRKAHVAPLSLGMRFNAKPNAFFLMTRGSRIEVNELDSRKAWQSIKHIHTVLGEFPQQNFMSVWPLVTNQKIVWPGQNALAAKTPWYSISNERNWDLNGLAEVVHKCI